MFINKINHKQLLISLLQSYHLTLQAQNYSFSENPSFDKGWKFHDGDVPFLVIKGRGDSDNNAEAGRACGAAAFDYDDYYWTSLNLPHYWSSDTSIDSSENLTGKAKIWTDGKMIEEKSSADPLNLKVELTKRKKYRSITVLIEDTVEQMVCLNEIVD